MIRNKLIDFLLDYLSAPSHCLFCGEEVLSRKRPLCNKCYEYYLKKLKQPCPVCLDSKRNCNCVNVKQCNSLVYMFVYGGKQLERLAYRIKRSATRFEMYFVAEEFAKKIAASYCNGMPFECITYVPRRKKDISYYGYDHIGFLANVVAEKLNLPCVKMIAHTGISGEQKRLTREQRKLAVKDRYIINKTVLKDNKSPYKSVLLLDDVVTSGATLETCARLMKEVGALEVHAAVISVAGYSSE